MHTVFALLCFVVVIHWLIIPYPSGLLHWHCGNLTIAPVPAKQPWWIWINNSCEFIMNDCITTTKQSTTNPCAYFLGYTVLRNYRMSFLLGKCGQWFVLLKCASMYKMQIYVFVVEFYYSYRRTGLYETSGKVCNLLTPVWHVKSSGVDDLGIPEANPTIAEFISRDKFVTESDKCDTDHDTW